MRIVEDAAAFVPDGSAPVCLLTTSLDGDTIPAMDALGVTASTQPRSMYRPTAVAVENAAELTFLTVSDDVYGRMVPVHILCTGAGMIIAAPDTLSDLLREAIQADDDGLGSVIIGIAIALARHNHDSLDNLLAESDPFDEYGRGFVSARQQRRMGRLRTSLFAIKETETAHARMMAPDGILTDVLSTADRHRLRRAAAAFEFNGSVATGLYARLGDVMVQQGTIVSERLTLVATIFLPLTLVTGFFGMNFGWMTRHLGTLPEFIGFGIALPAALAGLTLVLIRRLTR